MLCSSKYLLSAQKLGTKCLRMQVWRTNITETFLEYVLVNTLDNNLKLVPILFAQIEIFHWLFNRQSCIYGEKNYSNTGSTPKSHPNPHYKNLFCCPYKRRICGCNLLSMQVIHHARQGDCNQRITRFDLPVYNIALLLEQFEWFYEVYE